jgi:uncharacterized membrane protein YeaQ/YmgE (transglycosylase-associated protein family)
MVLIGDQKFAKSKFSSTIILVLSHSGEDDMESLIPLIVQLISGAVGGNVAGALFKNISLGTAGNSIVGILGGGIGGQLLSFIGAGGLEGIVGSLASGGVGGAVLMAIIGAIKKATAN